MNDIVSLENIAYLLKYDSVYEKEVSHDENNLIINGKKIQFNAVRSPEELAWKKKY